MRIEKKHLDDMKRCYCASSIHMNDENYLMFASEDPNVGCEMFHGPNFEYKETVWKEPGGCMSIIPIPGKEKQVLAVQEFYLKVSPSASKIVWGSYDDTSGWLFRDVLHMPYLHRFDIYHVHGVNYFIGATIATSKEHKDDWRVPGRIYVGEVPSEPDKGIDLEILCDDLYRNHGYWHGKEDGHDVGYFGSDQGILKVTPPLSAQDTWKKEIILEGKIGEIATIDIDQDGVEELMTIEEFHGDTIKVYKKFDQEYKEVYRYDQPIAFAHTLVGTTLAGVPTFLAGVRRVDAQIFAVQYMDGAFVTHTIDQGVGPANLVVVKEKDRDLIVAANHTKDEAAVYIVTK